MEKPLVSVGFPTRNRAHLLPQSLGSLLAQTYQNIEFIVSDNASADDTEQVVRIFAEKDRRIQYVRQRENIGGIKNHEFVLERARGKYFMWASDDDWWNPQFVEKLVGALEKNKEYGVAMSHYYVRFINDTHQTEKVLRTHDFINMPHQAIYRYYLRGGKTPIFFFGLFRTNLLKLILKRKTPVTYQGPVLFLCEVALATRFYSVPEPLHTRMQNVRSRISRHPDHPFALAEQRTLAVTHHILIALFWLLTSPAIPLSRKHLIFVPWLERLWFKKRKIVRELWRFVQYKFQNLF